MNNCARPSRTDECTSEKHLRQCYVTSRTSFSMCTVLQYLVLQEHRTCLLVAHFLLLTSLELRYPLFWDYCLPLFKQLQPQIRDLWFALPHTIVQRFLLMLVKILQNCSDQLLLLSASIDANRLDLQCHPIIFSRSCNLWPSAPLCAPRCALPDRRHHRVFCI